MQPHRDDRRSLNWLEVPTEVLGGAGWAMRGTIVEQAGSSAALDDRTSELLAPPIKEFTTSRALSELRSATARSSVHARADTVSREDAMALRRFVIERDIPKVGSFEREQLRGAAAKSNDVLRQLGPDIQWVESYVADNKTFCVYLAKGRGHHSKAC